MSRLLDDNQDELPQRERELTLSIGAILAIFLGLVLLCGVFFGFGYNMGRKSTTNSIAALPAATNETEPTDTSNSTFDNFKPSPTSPSTPPASKPPPAAAPAAPEPAPIKVEKVPAAASHQPENSSEPQGAVQPVHTATAGTPTSAPQAAPAPPPSTSTPTRPVPPAVTPDGAFVVQIAAISTTHKDDADLLANALHSKGYAVAERTEAQDKLIHIQVGPFATKAEAEAMRERLIVDGYNAIVK